jgi:phosphatidylinositol alpha-1,6-mannosyltransferase
MKTLLIMQDFLPALPGGIANYVYRMCLDLAPEMEALAPAYGDYAAFDQAQPFAIHRKPIPIEPPAFMTESRWHWLRLPYILYVAVTQLLLFLWYGWRVGRARNVDTILIGHLYLAPVGWVLGKVLRRPYGVVLYGGELHRYFHWPWIRLPLIATLNRAAFLTVITEFTRRQYIERGVRSDQRFVVVYPGVDTARFRPGIERDRWRERLRLHGKRVILTVARLVEWKGHTAVLHALPAVLKSVAEAHYVIAGNGPYRMELEQLVRQLGLEAHVTFAGFVPDAELPALYCSADVFVQASRDVGVGTEIEGFGIVFVEANACGLPVIGGRTGGTGEAIADGVSGVRVGSQNVEELAAALVRLLQDRPYAEQLGTQGRARAVREFEWSIQTQRLRGFLQTL